MNRKYGMILAAIVIFMFFLSLVFLFGQKYVDSKKRGPKRMPPAYGYNPEPWRQQPAPAQHSEYMSDPPPSYDASSAHIGLRSVSPTTPWRQSGRKDDDVDLDLGSQARPREFT